MAGPLRGPRPALGPSRRDALRASADVGLGITTTVLPSAAAAATGGATGAPEGSTLVTWSSGEQFDAWSSPTTTESDQPAVNGNVWQLFKAHQDIEITGGTADGLGIATTADGNDDITGVRARASVLGEASGVTVEAWAAARAFELDIPESSSHGSGR